MRSAQERRSCLPASAPSTSKCERPKLAGTLKQDKRFPSHRDVPCALRCRKTSSRKRLRQVTIKIMSDTQTTVLPGSSIDLPGASGTYLPPQTYFSIREV